MSAAVAPGGIVPRIVPLGRILRAEQIGLYRDAGQALRAAEQMAAEIRARAMREAESLRAARLAEIEQEVQRERTKVLAGTALAAQRVIAVLPGEFAQAIAEGVAKVIGGVDLAEAVARAAQRAVAELGDRHAIVVHVNPAALEPTRTRLTEQNAGIRVVADVGLAPDACIVETPGGFVRAGLREQIETLRSVLQAAAGADG